MLVFRSTYPDMWKSEHLDIHISLAISMHPELLPVDQERETFYRQTYMRRDGGEA